MNGSSTQLAVDREAELNVCPLGWGIRVGTGDSDKWLNMTDASGGIIEHFGQTFVDVVSPS